MPFTRKSTSPIPPIKTQPTKDKWLKTNFTWLMEPGETYFAEAKKMYETYGSGEPGWEEFSAQGSIDRVNPDTDTIKMSKSELAELINSAVEKKLAGKIPASGGEDMKELVSELVEQLSPTGVRRKLYKEENIDQNDYLNEPVMFFTYRIYMSIFSERRYGQEVNTPYGRPIRFTNISTNVQGGIGRNSKEVLQIAAAQITTKKEAEWLRRSPMFGVVFFETIGEMQNIDKKRADHLGRALGEIAGLTEYQVMKRATDSGLGASKDVEMMRAKLIQKIAADNLSVEEGVSRGAASTQDAAIDATIKRGVNRNQLTAGVVY